MLGDEEQSSRVVLRGVYVPNTDPDETTLPVPQGVALGEALEVNDTLRLTCLDSTPLTLLPDTPPGYVNVSVDFRVKNRLPTLPLVTAAFAHFLPESFDVIYLCTVLGEIPDREAALQHAYAALKPGGLLSITEIFPDPHYQSRAVVQQLAEAPGFRLREIHGPWYFFTANFVKV